MHDKTHVTQQLTALAAGLFASATAFAWGDAAITAWTARNTALVAAVNQPIDAGAPPDASGQPALYYVDARGFMYKPNADEKAAMAASGQYAEVIKQACSGLTGELIKNGGKNMPVWAQTAQQKFCAGVDGLNKALADDAADKTRCKELSSAISYAQKAKPGEDPEAVLESAAALIAAAEKLRGTPIIMTQKGKVLGDSNRTFTCK